MRRALLATVAGLLLLLLLFPPWCLEWAPAPGQAALNPLETTWAGFHSWGYAAERPSREIAWDGPGGGGHVTLIGTPRLALWFASLNR